MIQKVRQGINHKKALALGLFRLESINCFLFQECIAILAIYSFYAMFDTDSGLPEECKHSFAKLEYSWQFYKANVSKSYISEWTLDKDQFIGVS